MARPINKVKAVICADSKKTQKFLTIEFLKPFLGVLSGGIISIITAYFSAKWAADSQRNQILFGQVQSFSEFMTDRGLPMAGDVSQKCQGRLLECRRRRESAITMYLFLPTEIQEELIKSYGKDAVKFTSADNSNLSDEMIATRGALKQTREWLTGKKDDRFNFIFPCADWKKEEDICSK